MPPHQRQNVRDTVLAQTLKERIFKAAFSIVNFARIFKTANKKIACPKDWMGCFLTTRAYMALAIGQFEHAICQPTLKRFVLRILLVEFGIIREQSHDRFLQRLIVFNARILLI